MILFLKKLGIMITIIILNSQIKREILTNGTFHLTNFENEQNSRDLVPLVQFKKREKHP